MIARCTGVCCGAVDGSLPGPGSEIDLSSA